MATITIPKNLIKEKDLMVIALSEYKSLLKYVEVNEEHENLWEDSSKDKFLKSYDKSDSIYDQI